jgi:cell division protein ZapB
LFTLNRRATGPADFKPTLPEKYTFKSSLTCNTIATAMTETHLSIELKDFEGKLDQLIKQYHSLKIENSSLKTKQELLIQEKARLLEKTDQAKTRVEAMITHLKAMERDS